MSAIIIAIIMALISYFTAKKSGATDGQAALLGAAAGAGSYYVATETEWGKGVIASVDEGWDTLFGPDDVALVNADGSTVKAPPGAVVQVDGSGNPIRDSAGNVAWKVVDSAGNVLESWGPTGTAAVIGTTALATGSGDLAKYVPWAIGGVALIMLAK